MDPAAAKPIAHDLLMVDCPNCEQPWRLAVDDDDEQVYVYCECPGKDPEPVSDWVSRFMAEQYDDEETLRGFQ